VHLINITTKTKKEIRKIRKRNHCTSGVQEADVPLMPGKTERPRPKDPDRISMIFDLISIITGGLLQGPAQAQDKDHFSTLVQKE
jgi:hypothetical protein